MSRSMTSNYNLWTVGGKRPLQYTYERGARGKSYFTPTKWWIDSYEKQDDRAQNYILRKYFIINDATANAPYPADVLPSGYKYGDTLKCKWSVDLTRTVRSKPDWPATRKSEGGDPSNMAADFSWSDQIYLRLAETYLLKAEAQFKLGQPEAAATTINIIRARSKATPVTAAAINLDFILDERSREVFLEDKSRFTILRTQQLFETYKLNNHW